MKITREQRDYVTWCVTFAQRVNDIMDSVADDRERDVIRLRSMGMGYADIARHMPKMTGTKARQLEDAVLLRLARALLPPRQPPPE